MRFLEAQNRKLAADLEALRGRWGKDTSSIKQMYEGERRVLSCTLSKSTAGELTEARKLIDQTAKDRANIEEQIGKLQKDLADYRKK